MDNTNLIYCDIVSFVSKVAPSFVMMCCKDKGYILILIEYKMWLGLLFRNVFTADMLLLTYNMVCNARFVLYV